MKVLFLLCYLLSANSKEINLKIKNYFDSNNGKMNVGLNLKVDDGIIVSINDKKIKNYDYDLSSYYVVPGLIDSHNHLLILDKSYGQNFAKEIAEKYNLDSEERIKRAQEIGSSLVLAGITSSRDLGNSGQYLDLEVKKEFLDKPFPRLYISGPGIASDYGQFTKRDKELANKEYDIINSSEDIERILQVHSDHHVNVIKVFSDNEPGSGFIDENFLCQLVSKAHDKKIKVSAHSTNALSAKRAIKCGVDSIEHGFFLPNEVLKEMAKKKITLVPTDMPEGLYLKLMTTAKKMNVPVTQWEKKFYKKALSDRLLQADRLGVPLAFGSDMYIDCSELHIGQGQAVKETLYSYVENGLNPKKILIMATKGSAELIGDKKLGQIAIGSYGDLIVTRNNPLNNIRALDDLVFVMSKGKVILNKL